MRPATGALHAAAAPADPTSREVGFPSKLTLLLVGTLTIMSAGTIAPSLPAIEAHFAGEDDAALLTRLVLTVPALFIALCAPLVGVGADRFGRRRLLIAAVAVYAFAGISGLVLDSLHGLLVGRALLGVAVAGVMTTATALAADYFSGRERDGFMEVQSAFTGLSGLLFMAGGGLLADMHWRLPFAVYGLALALSPAVAMFIADADHPDRRRPNAAGEPVGLRLPLPIVALFGTAVLNSVIFYLIPTQLPFHLRSLGAAAPSQAGMAIGLLSLAMAAMSLAYGRLRGRLGLAGMFAAGFGLIAAGHGLAAAAASYLVIVAAVVVIGLGMAMPNFGAAAMAIAPPAVRGRISGGLTASIFLGQFISPLVSQPLIGSHGIAAAFCGAALLLAAMAVAAAVVAGSSVVGRAE